MQVEDFTCSTYIDEQAMAASEACPTRKLGIITLNRLHYLQMNIRQTSSALCGYKAKKSLNDH